MNTEQRKILKEYIRDMARDNNVPCKHGKEFKDFFGFAYNTFTQLGKLSKSPKHILDTLKIKYAVKYSIHLKKEYVSIKYDSLYDLIKFLTKEYKKVLEDKNMNFTKWKNGEFEDAPFSHTTWGNICQFAGIQSSLSYSKKKRKGRRKKKKEPSDKHTKKISKLLGYNSLIIRRTYVLSEDALI